MQVGFSAQKTVAIMQPKLMQHTDVAPINAISVLLVLLLPVAVIGGAIVTYRKHKARVLRERIQRLNRLWQLDTSKKTS